MAATVRQKEMIRGKIPYYLGLIYPQAATLPLLQGELDPPQVGAFQIVNVRRLLRLQRGERLAQRGVVRLICLDH